MPCPRKIEPAPACGANGPGFIIAALYKFTDLPDHRDLQPRLQELCDAHGVHGTLLLADEGINGTVCAPPAGMAAVLDWIEADDRFDGLSLKFSVAPKQAFLRMKVRLKKEIVTMGRPEISPARATGTYVEPEDWNRLVEDPDVMVIDTRNAYETATGSFPARSTRRPTAFANFRTGRRTLPTPRTGRKSWRCSAPAGSAARRPAP